MTNIGDARKAVVEFLKKTIGARDAKVIRMAKNGTDWNVEAEVYEESSFIKALGLSTKVQDRNVYLVKLNENLEVDSYGLKGTEGQEEK
ncbi:MAG: hypothetical protein PHW04_03345 [Candidatus Wallbacteria bacterium]|nr:hypothetical protein [Candidatus Wallbacteria bacterium]